MKTYISALVFTVLLSATAAALAADVALPVPEYTSAQLRDPFQSYVTKEEAPITQAELREELVNPPQLTIQGITWGSRFSQAIVNNKVVKVGDMIEGAEVVQIKSIAVVFRFGNREFTLAGPAGVKAQE